VNKGATFEAVSTEAHAKSVAIVENVAAGRVPDDQVQPVLVQALNLDPFNARAWTAWLDRYGDQDASLAVCADAFGIDDVNAHKAKLIAERKADLSWSTPEECRANSVLLEQYAEWLGFPFSTERSLIEARAVKLDRQRRTFNGVEYPSLVEATEARQAHDDVVQRTVEGIVHDTHDGANEARAQIRDQAIASSRAITFKGWCLLGYRRYREIKTRSSRKEFWSFLFFAFSAITILTISSNIGQDRSGLDGFEEFIRAIISLIYLGFFLYTVVSYLTLQIRRFHDQDRSGWLVLLNLIPYVGWAIVLAFMLVDGTPGDNRFGPSPKQT
jgi:uncharacterized membrane protein YhaH (DUF805 family)